MNNEFVKVNKELKPVLRERMQRKQQSDWFYPIFHLQVDVCPLVVINVSTVQSNIWKRRVVAITSLNHGDSKVHIL